MYHFGQLFQDLLRLVTCDWKRCPESTQNSWLIISLFDWSMIYKTARYK